MSVWKLKATLIVKIVKIVKSFVKSEKAFNGPSKICGRQPLKHFTWSILEYFVPNKLQLNVIYFFQEKSSLSDKIESVHHKAMLAIIGVIREFSYEKLYQELGFESLRNRRWLRRMPYLNKINSTNRFLICMN